MRAPRLLRHQFARSRPELTRADRRENPTFRPIVRAASALVVLLLAGCEGTGPKATKLLPDTKELTNAAWKNTADGLNDAIGNEKPGEKR